MRGEFSYNTARKLEEVLNTPINTRSIETIANILIECSSDEFPYIIAFLLARAQNKDPKLLEILVNRNETEPVQ